VQVHYDEGLANRVDPEPCGPVREGRLEASAGARIGQPSSRESFLNPDADAVQTAEGDAGGRVISRAPVWSGVVLDPGMCVSSLYQGTGRSRDWPGGFAAAPVRVGKVKSRSR